MVVSGAGVDRPGKRISHNVSETLVYPYTNFIYRNGGAQIYSYVSQSRRVGNARADIYGSCSSSITINQSIYDEIQFTVLRGVIQRKKSLKAQHGNLGALGSGELESAVGNSVVGIEGKQSVPKNVPIPCSAKMDLLQGVKAGQAVFCL